jgi:hypothetical protein
MTDIVLSDRWTTRDFPVLRAVATRLDQQPGTSFRASELADDLGLSREDCIYAADALNGVYLTANPKKAWGGTFVEVIVTGLTERGRRTAGLWPAGDGGGPESLIDALRQAADSAADPEEAGALRRAAGSLLSIGRDVLVDVTAALIAKQAGA